MKEHTPYLVQRIETRQTVRDDDVGVDRHFRFDYMGSAEFEFGALPKALKAIRATKLMNEPKRIKHPDGHIVWYVGPKELFETAKKLFFSQLKDRYEPRLKESTYISEVFGTDKLTIARVKKGIERSWKPNTIGWWDIMSTYAFFCKKDDAKKWLDCVLKKR